MYLILKKKNACVCVQVGVLVFRRYRNKNIKSMNFDNPVYRKTTTDDDKVYMEKTGSRQNLPAVRNLIIIIFVLNAGCLTPAQRNSGCSLWIWVIKEACLWPEYIYMQQTRESYLFFSFFKIFTCICMLEVDLCNAIPVVMSL